jgi:hypothetical protein
MFQLIYASAATKNFSHDELSSLLIKARPNNIALGITGMMLYHSGSFLQILEGDDDNVNALFSIIERDKRHTNVKIIYRDIADGNGEREFEDWSMGFVNTAKYTNLPGGFVNYATELESRTLDKTRAKKVMKMFQQGTWRQTIDR